MNAVFLDRDGTVTVGIPKYERIDSIEKVELLPDVVEALAILAGLDVKVFLVTNRAGIAEGLINLADFWTINDKVLELIAPSGINICETYVCPHGEHSNCDCHKPKPKMLLDAAKKYKIDLGQSYMVGDRITDVQTGLNAGTKTILVQTGEIVSSPSGATYAASNLVDPAQYIASH